MNHHKLVASSAGLLLAVSSACTSSTQTPRAQTTSAQITASGSPDLRTVDNTGFVGPAGQTRSVSAGTGGTQIGRSEGVPPPHREVPGGGETSASPPAQLLDSATAGEPIARAARALCDRETFCARIGPGQAHDSADSCMADMRERIARRGTADRCGQTIRNDRLAACLSAIRAASCEPRGAPQAPPPAACTADALCD